MCTESREVDKIILQLTKESQHLPKWFEFGENGILLNKSFDFYEYERLYGMKRKQVGFSKEEQNG